MIIEAVLSTQYCPVVTHTKQSPNRHKLDANPLQRLLLRLPILLISQTVGTQ